MMRREKGLFVFLAALVVVAIVWLLALPALNCTGALRISDSSRGEVPSISPVGKLVKNQNFQLWDSNADLPVYFGGIGPGGHYPRKGFSLKQLELCKAALGGPYTEDKLHKCEDKTCVSCISKEHFMQVQPILDAHWDKELSRKRRAQFREWFGDPRAKEYEVDGTPRSNIISIIAVDSSTMHMAYNWACAAHLVSGKSAVERLLLITSHLDEFKSFMQAGLLSVDPRMMYDERMHYPLKTKGFRWSMSMLIVTVSELVDMGYDVLVQDADVVWRRDPRPELEADPRIANLDLMFQQGVRFDAQGPSNTGVIYVRSNKKTRLFLNSMVNALVMVYHMFDDQRFWNNMLRHYWFAQLHWQLLPTSIVLGMFNHIKLWPMSRLEAMNPAILHRVGNQGAPHSMAMGKAMDLHKLGCWHFTEQCPIAKPSTVELPPQLFSVIQESGLNQAGPLR